MFVKLSVLLAIVASVYFCFAPTVETVDLGGSRRISLLQSQGWGVIIPLGIPIVLAALPLAPFPGAGGRAIRIISAILLLAFAVAASPTVGLFYAPSAVLMIIAAARG